MFISYLSSSAALSKSNKSPCTLSPAHPARQSGARPPMRTSAATATSTFTSGTRSAVIDRLRCRSEQWEISSRPRSMAKSPFGLTPTPEPPPRRLLQLLETPLPPLRLLPLLHWPATQNPWLPPRPPRQPPSLAAHGVVSHITTPSMPLLTDFPSWPTTTSSSMLHLQASSVPRGIIEGLC